jgi:hypothetical protein
VNCTFSMRDAHEGDLGNRLGCKMSIMVRAKGFGTVTLTLFEIGSMLVVEDYESCVSHVSSTTCTGYPRALHPTSPL